MARIIKKIFTGITALGALIANAPLATADVEPALFNLQGESIMPAESRLGQISGRIVGGDISDFGEQRWIGSLQYQGRHFCGLSLIHPRWAVTAAHCVSGLSLSSTPLTVWVGGNDLRVDSQGVRRSVSRIIVHPSYNPNNLGHDIALLQLDRSITTITPAQIASASIMTNEAAPGQPVNVSGWGMLSESGGQPSLLHDVTVPVVSNGTCNDPLSYGGQVTSNMVCAGVREGGQDACQGDSGGPLWLTVNGVDVHVGVVSWGTGCARPNKYGVYTRMVSYRNWITSAANISLSSPNPSGTPPGNNPDNCVADQNQPSGGNNTANPSANQAQEFTYTFGQMQRQETLVLQVTVPENIQEMILETSGGQGDLDIYFAKDQRPTLRTYDFASRNPDSSERIRVLNPEPGTWYVLAHAFSSTAGVEFRLQLNQ